MNGAKPRRKPWFARARVDNEHYSLGYFDSREEAVEVEDAFREYMREQRQQRTSSRQPA